MSGKEGNKMILMIRLTLFECSNVNIAWSRAGMMDADYLLAFEKIIMPISKTFDPELVIGKQDTSSHWGGREGGEG